MPKITFFIRKNKDQKNTHSLYCRVTYRRTKAEFSTGEKVTPSDWNQKFQRVKELDILSVTPLNQI